MLRGARVRHRMRFIWERSQFTYMVSRFDISQNIIFAFLADLKSDGPPFRRSTWPIVERHDTVPASAILEMVPGGAAFFVGPKVPTKKSSTPLHPLA